MHFTEKGSNVAILIGAHKLIIKFVDLFTPSL